MQSSNILGKNVVIVVTEDANVERWSVDAPGGGGATPDWSVSLRRSGCASDTLVAAPEVQLRRNASAAFQAQYAYDLVYVGTRLASCMTGDE